MSRARFQPQIFCDSGITALLAVHVRTSPPLLPLCHDFSVVLSALLLHCLLKKTPNWNWLLKCFKEAFYFYVKEANLANVCGIFERKVRNNLLQNGILYRLTKQPASNRLLGTFPTRWEQKHHYHWTHVILNENKP